MSWYGQRILSPAETQSPVMAMHSFFGMCRLEIHPCRSAGGPTFMKYQCLAVGGGLPVGVVLRRWAHNAGDDARTQALIHSRRFRVERVRSTLGPHSTPASLYEFCVNLLLHVSAWALIVKHRYSQWMSGPFQRPLTDQLTMSASGIRVVGLASNRLEAHPTYWK